MSNVETKYATIEAFASACERTGRGFEKLAGFLHVLVIVAVNKAYGSTDKGGEWVAALLNPMPQYVRRQLAGYLRKNAGLNIPELGQGDKLYVIPGDCVLDRSKQAGFVDKVKNTPVYVTEVKEGRKPRVKTLTGTPQERANAAVASAIARLKKDDPDAAAALNYTYCTATCLCMYTQEGERIAMTREQVEAVQQILSNWDNDSITVEVPALKIAA